jgi:preprotein translocase subunit SecD
VRQRLIASIAIILLVCAGHACSVTRSKSPSSLITLEVDADAPDREAAVKTTIDILSRRLDALGVSDFKVQQGDLASGRIMVSPPTGSDPERIKSMVTAGGRLEMTRVISPSSPAPAQTYNTKQEAFASLGATLPTNRRVLPFADNEIATAEPIDIPKHKQWVVVESPAIVDSSDLRNASAIKSRHDREDYKIVFTLKTTGAEKLRAWTGAHINSYVAIVLNDEVRSIPYIMSQVTSDEGEIDGRFTKQLAEDLAIVLRSGALPAPVRIVKESVNK